jgi:hypothetical protein
MILPLQPESLHSAALLPTDVARADLISTERAINSGAQTYRETILEDPRMASPRKGKEARGRTY